MGCRPLNLKSKVEPTKKIHHMVNSSKPIRNNLGQFARKPLSKGDLIDIESYRAKYRVAVISVSGDGIRGKYQMFWEGKLDEEGDWIGWFPLHSKWRRV